MTNAYSERKYIVIGIVLLCGIIFAIRLFYLQVVDDSYKLDAKNQAFRYLTDYAVRGYIYDRKGKLLVYNEAAYDLMVTPKQVKEIDTMALCKLLDITKESFLRKMKKANEAPNSPRKPSIFEKQISAQTYAALQEKLYKFKGFFVQSRTLRKYPKKIAAHLLGYIGEVDKNMTEKDPYYKEGDYIGISGIEKSYEAQLRGKKGLRIMMVDVHNREKGSYAEGRYDTLSIPGLQLSCTLDADLQEYGELLMTNKIGSAVAIDPSTGEILALVTSPTYDPNLMVGRVRSVNYSKLAQDTIGVPLYNRALMAPYPPGSTFKLVDALIGLQEGVLTPHTLYPCRGGYPPLGGKPKCHNHASPCDLTGAIGTSCNSYFSYVFKSILDNKKYKNDQEGFEYWRKYVLSFGIGRRLNADIVNELRGTLPTSTYYSGPKVFGKNWKASNIISLGIGQAELGVTQLQGANIVAAIANRGYYYIPHIVRAVNGNPNDTSLARFKVKNYTLVHDTACFNDVIEGMSKAVQSGTAAQLKIPGVEFCAKTGTAQNPHGKDHSVFVAFAPKENPKIAIAVLVENAGFGATWAGPIATLMMEKYLKGKIERLDMEKRIIEANLIEMQLAGRKK